jgi:hypothetical protein
LNESGSAKNLNLP